MIIGIQVQFTSSSRTFRIASHAFSFPAPAPPRDIGMDHGRHGDGEPCTTSNLLLAIPYIHRKHFTAHLQSHIPLPIPSSNRDTGAGALHPPPRTGHQERLGTAAAPAL
jgi:hypothetical protein